MQEKWLVTHYFPSLLKKNTWIPLQFITQISGQTDYYYYGFDRKIAFLPEVIERRVKANNLAILNEPVEIISQQKIWLTPEGTIYLASGLNPENDPQKKKLNCI